MLFGTMKSTYQFLMSRTLTFTISEKQYDKLRSWIESLPCPEPLIDHPEFPKISYEFNSWSGIGTEVKAIENITGACIDLTDIEEW